MKLNKIVPHFHLDENGILQKCYHRSKTALLDPFVWLTVTISFPIEHIIWKIPPLSWIADYFGFVF